MSSTYIGTKTVKATPMNRREYNDYRGWTLPENEVGTDPGYLVEYTDGGVPNDSRHAGYISWSPKGQFNGAYTDIGDVSNLVPYQQRVVGEHALHKDMTTKLLRYTVTTTFKTLPFIARELLLQQSRAMVQYQSTLEKRIATF